MTAARRGLLVPSLVALVAFVALVSLGVWQLQRLQWKRALIATLDERFAAAPIALPAPSEWRRLDRDAYEYRRVTFRAEYLPARAGQRGNDGRVWSVGSALRDDLKGPGFFVFNPARLASGEIIVVNRGFVADEKPTWRTPVPPVVSGVVEITGILRWPEPGSWFVGTPYDAGQDIWFVRDNVAMAEANRWGATAPFSVERESQVPPDGLPAVTSFKANLANNHLGYALTWFGLALVLAASFGVWVASRRRQPA